MLPLHLLFICLSIYSLICCSSGCEEAAWLWAAEYHPFQLHLCGSSESCILPRPYDGAELHKTCSAVVSSCGKDTCVVTSDKTLHFSECLSFRQRYADCEKQMQSGPFGIRATEMQIKVRKIQENYTMQIHCLSKSPKYLCVATAEGISPHSQLLSICLLLVAGLTRINAFSSFQINDILKRD